MLNCHPRRHPAHRRVLADRAHPAALAARTPAWPASPASRSPPQASVMERNLTRYTIITGVLFFLNTFVLIWRLG